MDSGNDKKREALYAVQILKDLGRLNAIWILDYFPKFYVLSMGIIQTIY